MSEIRDLSGLNLFSDQCFDLLHLNVGFSFFTVNMVNLLMIFILVASKSKVN